MANLLNLSEIYELTRTDSSPCATNLMDYSASFQPVISNNWLYMCTSVTAQNLVCSQFQYRLAFQRPDPSKKDFWVAKLHESQSLIHFVKSTIWRLFVLQKKCIYINFSPSFIIKDTLTSNTYFLYSSRSNFACLNQSFLIEGEASFLQFCDEILPNYDLQNYTVNQLSFLNRKYPTGYLLPTALTFHVTASVSMIYGVRALFNERGTSNDCCVGPNAKAPAGTDCIWTALSAVVAVKRGGKVVPRGLIRLGRWNRRVATSLKSAFLRWHQKNFMRDFCNPVTHMGFRSEALGKLEQFLGMNIVIYNVRRRGQMKIQGTKVVKTRGDVKHFKVEYMGSGWYDKTVHLLSDGRHHVKSVTNLKQFCAKFNCEFCLSRFREARKLKNHQETNSCQPKLRFRGESLVMMDTPIKKLIELSLPKWSNIPFDHSFALITLNRRETRENGGGGGAIDVKLQWVTGRHIHGVRECFRNTDDASAYLFELIPHYGCEILGRRMLHHTELMAGLETELNQCARASDLQFVKDERVLHYENLLRIKREMLKYWSRINCFIQCESDEIGLGEDLMMSLLSKLCNNDDSSVSIKNNNGKIYSVERTKYPVIFKWLTLLSPVFLRPVSPEHLRHLIRSFKNDFKLDLLSITTISQLGRQMMTAELSRRDAMTLFSPSRELHSYIDRATKFGLLGATPTVIHEDSDYKAAISLDVSKFYTYLLQKTYVYYGKSVEYVPNKNGTFTCNANRKRATFANLLLLTLDHVLEGEIYTANGGTEARLDLPVDGVLFTGGVNYVLSYEGCLFHCTCLTKPCHQAKPDRNHELTCLACKNHKLTHYLKPCLYKLKAGETMKSAHPIKKTLTYEKVSEKSKNNFERVKTACDGRYSLICIKECDIVQYYYSPLSDLTSHFALPLDKKFEKVILKDAMELVTRNYFPMMQKVARGLNMATVLKAIREDELAGFVVVTLSIGPAGMTQLGQMRPFAFKNDIDGRSVNSYHVNEEIISTEYLKFILSRISEVTVQQIHKIFEYSKPQYCLYAKMAAKAESIMNERQDEKQYVQLIKTAVNGSIGSLSFSPTKYNKTIVSDCRKMLSVTKLKSLIKSTPINDDFGLFIFKNRSSICNLSHQNYQIILMGKQLLIDFVLSLKTFLAIEVKRENTDGIVLCAKVALPHDILSEKNAQALCFDSLLWPTLTNDDLRAYFAFKRAHFVNLGVCPSHEHLYLTSLFKKIPFKQGNCCVNYENKPSCMTVKIELLCNKGLIVSCNKLAIFNTNIDNSIIKCSGVTDGRLFDSVNYSYDELKAFSLIKSD